MAQSKTTKSKGRGGRGGGSTHEVGFKVGLENTGGSKGGGARLVIEPEVRKRRRRESSPSSPRRRVRTRGLDEASPAARRMACGAAVFAVRQGSRVLVLAEEGVLGFLPRSSGVEVLSEWRRNGGEELIGTVTETGSGSRPIGLELSFVGGYRESQRPTVEKAGKSDSVPQAATALDSSTPGRREEGPGPSGLKEAP